MAESRRYDDLRMSPVSLAAMTIVGVEYCCPGIVCNWLNLEYNCKHFYYNVEKEIINISCVSSTSLNRPWKR